MVFVLFAILWYFFSPYIIWATIKTTVAVKWLLTPFHYFMSSEKVDFLMNMEEKINRNLDYSKATFSDLTFFLNILFRSLSVILVPLFLWRGITNIKNSKKNSFTRNLSLRDLQAIHAERNPRMKPAFKADLANKDHRFGGWATSRNPLEYLIFNKAISDIEDPELSIIGLKRFSELTELEQLNELERFHGKLVINKAKAHTIFQSQLGQLCTYSNNKIINIDNLPLVDRAMAIIFLATRLQTKEVRVRINKLLDQFGDSFVEAVYQNNSMVSPHKVDFSGVNELWNDIKDHPNVLRALLKISQTHAYWSTAFTAMYEFVYSEFRNIKSRDFAFLKPINRQLYLICNQVGLERARAETVMVRIHYLDELDLKAPIVKADIELSFMSLAQNIQEEGWLTEDIVKSSLVDMLEELDGQCEQDLIEYNELNPTEPNTQQDNNEVNNQND
jgi:hypothetical protein